MYSNPSLASNTRHRSLVIQCGLVSMLGPGLDSNACTTVAHVSLPQLPTCHLGLHCTHTKPQVSSERESTPSLGDSSCKITHPPLPFADTTLGCTLVAEPCWTPADAHLCGGAVQQTRTTKWQRGIERLLVAQHRLVLSLTWRRCSSERAYAGSRLRPGLRRHGHRLAA